MFELTLVKSKIGGEDVRRENLTNPSMAAVGFVGVWSKSKRCYVCEEVTSCQFVVRFNRKGI